MPVLFQIEKSEELRVKCFCWVNIEGNARTRIWIQEIWFPGDFLLSTSITKWFLIDLQIKYVAIFTSKLYFDMIIYKMGVPPFTRLWTCEYKNLVLLTLSYMVLSKISSIPELQLLIALRYYIRETSTSKSSVLDP